MTYTAAMTMKLCIKCDDRKPETAFRGQRRVCRACEKAYEDMRSLERKAERASSQMKRDRCAWYRPIGRWPWPPGTKVFEDMPLKRRIAA